MDSGISLLSLTGQYAQRLSPALVEEAVQREKAVFIIHRNQPLSEIRDAFLVRLKAALEGLAEGRESPDPPQFLGENESRLRQFH